MSDETPCDITQFAKIVSIADARDQLESLIRAIGRSLGSANTAQISICIDVLNQLVTRFGGELLAWQAWGRGLSHLLTVPTEALAHFEQAITLFEQFGRPREAARLSIVAAGLNGQLGRPQNGLDTLVEARLYFAAEPDYIGWPSLELNASDLAGRTGNYTAMLAYATDAEHHAIRLNQPDVVARARVNRGYADVYLGNLAPATEQLLRALAEAERLELPEVAGRAALNLARICTYRGELFEALQWLERGRLEFAAAELDLEQATVDLEEAALYERLWLIPDATAAAIRSANRFAENGYLRESVEARLMAVWLLLTHHSTTTKKAREQLALAEQLRASCSFVLQALLDGYAAHPRFETADALLRMKEAAERLDALGAAVEALELRLLQAALSKPPDARRLLAQLVVQAQTQQLPAIEQEARVALSRHLSISEALTQLQRASDLIVAARKRLPQAELKARLIAGASSTLRLLFERQLEARDMVGALATVVEAKAGLWQELLAAQPGAEPAIDWIQAKGNLLRWESEAQFAREAQDKAYEEQCNHEIDIARRTLERIARLNAAEPDVVLPRKPLTQHLMRPSPQEVVAEFFTTETAIYINVITADGPGGWTRVAALKDVQRILRRLELLVYDLQQSVTVARRRAAARQTQFDMHLAALYEHLIDPVITQLIGYKRLWIAPDALLFSVPWAALIDQQGVYLGSQFELGLTPSIAFFADDDSGEAAAQGNAYAFINLAIDERATMQEATAALSTLPIPFIVTQDASAAALSALPATRILHLVAHGVSDRNTPQLSRLMLADGPFLLADAARLPLAGTELVTLSVCESGVIPASGGVVLALAGGFLLAGAKTVVPSMWSVDTHATTLFMSYFYRALADSRSVPRSVQKAQEQLRGAGFENPYYWAAFLPITLRPATY